MSDMIHFVRQLQAYCHLEVIQCQCKKLLDFIHKKEGGLDGLITAHKSYVTAVDKKALLWYPKAGKEVRIAVYWDEERNGDVNEMVSDYCDYRMRC